MKLFKFFRTAGENKDSSDLPLLSKADSTLNGVNFFNYYSFARLTHHEGSDLVPHK